jgi:hypothetical protein
MVTLAQDEARSPGLTLRRRSLSPGRSRRMGVVGAGSSDSSKAGATARWTDTSAFVLAKRRAARCFLAVGG